MKLLLIYPQPAHKPKSRLSRRGAQLEGIADAVRNALKQRVGAQLQISEFGYERDNGDAVIDAAANRESLSSSFDDSDLVIDISSTPDVNVASADFAGPVVHLSPAFPGSFACNDIAIVGRGRLLQADIVNSISASREPYHNLLPKTHELDASMHYAKFSTLPTRIGEAFYRNEREHALIQLSYPEQVKNKQTVNDDIEVLAKALHELEQLRSLTFVCDSLQDVSLIQHTADALKQSLGVKTAIWGLRKGEFQDMFAIIAKADVAFFGGNALYADAILHGVPVFTWRSEQPGTEGITKAYQTFCEDGNRNALLQQQRAQLDRLFEALYFDATIPNHRACFLQVLEDIINMAVHKAELSIPQPLSSEPGWVIPPARISETRSLPDKLSRSVWRDRQSLLKFKQPSNRATRSGRASADTHF